VKKAGGKARRIQARSPQANEEWIIFRSRSHPGERLQAFLDKVGPHQTLSMGSSLKTCLIAEGKADFYPRLGPTSEWDTAAAHCILREAGGDITDTNMATLQYNTKESILNPEFFAFGKDNPDWSEYLK
jgi:3'(2'), 5'-bisphosphate nucleotidase